MIDDLAIGVIDVAGDCRLAARVNGQVVDLYGLSETGALPLSAADRDALHSSNINAFLELGATRHREVYEALNELSNRDDGRLNENALALDSAPLRLPVAPGDFVDFYASRHHAERCVRLTGNEDLLPEAWEWMPLGYHGRTASVMGHGAAITRPQGWMKSKQGWAVRSSRLVDFEMELGFVMRNSTAQGARITADDFDDAVFGAVLVIDWSARDLQGAEATPLGPFHSKAFATQIGDWVVPVETLAAHQVAAGELRPKGRMPVTGHMFDIEMRAELSTLQGEAIEVSKANLCDMGWTPAELAEHLTLSGAPVRSGDVFATGTVSGPEAGALGCLLERQAEKSNSLTLSNGVVRHFLVDGDLITIDARLGRGDKAVSFGKLTGSIYGSVEN